MKRGWSIVRLVLAALLMALAWGIYAFWPSSPLIQVENEEVVGFDEAKELFYSSTTLDLPDQQVKTYDLKTGNLVSSITLKTPPSRMGRWPLVLTNDGRFLIPMSAALGMLSAVRLPSLESVSDDTVLKDVTRAYGMSADGQLLLFQDLEIKDDTEAIMIWDIERNQPFDRFVFPQKPVLLNWGSSNHLPSNTLQMTSDRRYVAANLFRSFVVYDRMERKVVLQIEDARVIPRFTSNGTMLSLVPDTKYGKNEPISLYQLQDGKWSFLREAPLKLAEDETVSQIGDQFLMTQEFEFEGSTPEWLSKLPDGVHNWIARFMLRYTMTLRFRDLETGEITSTVKQNCPSLAGQNLQNFLIHLSVASCSSRGRYFALTQPPRSLQVWARDPIRPLHCWLIAVGVLFLAMRIGWPRRVSAG